MLGLVDQTLAGRALRGATQTVSLSLALVALGIAGLGCESPAGGGAVDAGGGGMDGGRDLPDTGPPPVDAGRPPAECEGVPLACATRDETNCDTVEGCVLTNCRGVPVACNRFVDQATCDTQQGCRWSGTACGGSAAPCERIVDESACGNQQGCLWNAMQICRGTPRPCAEYMRAACTTQPGCDVVMEPVDAGPPPPRDGGGVCIPPEPLRAGGCNDTDGIECDGDWSAECTPACSASQCCSPQRGRFMCVDRDASGNCPAADLWVDGDRITGRYRIERDTFSPTSCEIVEGCVMAPGARRLLRFDTWTPNTGTADMFLGSPSAPRTRDHFEYSDCHRHFHFNSYAEYELLTPDRMCVVATGHKQAFCLLDYYAYPGTDDRGARYTCSFQGIQRDWQDVYSAGLDCQFVDITDVAPGEYVLRIRINTDHILYETDYANNEIFIPVTIPAG